MFRPIEYAVPVPTKRPAISPAICRILSEYKREVYIPTSLIILKLDISSCERHKRSSAVKRSYSRRRLLGDLDLCITDMILDTVKDSQTLF